ncbi:MAG: hypothetical protein F4Y26_02830 [Gammaproteobacteria bacterium]|nr:hypothetical protein [Gammaproteobacteria bacterium]
MNNRRVSRDSLDWAISHVARHGDTDIFPVPFEYGALSEEWPEILQRLTSRRFDTMPARAPLILPVPKAQGGFRIAHQLDPIDTLVYTALVYEMGQHIERYRQGGTACAYRFDSTTAGDFYPQDNGWGTFTERSRYLAGRSSFVLHLDLADFYNQIYHHRLAGALESAGISKERAVNVEKFLGRFTAWQSQGIPVGPSASHLLAECCLVDIDSSLRTMRVGFVRYIDDFRIFAKTKRTLNRVQQDLCELLYTNHRLAVQGSKTYIESTDRFLRHRLNDPKAMVEDEVEARLDELAAQINEETGYEVTIEDVDEDTLEEEVGECLEELLGECLSATPVHFGTIRFVLRMANRMQSGAITGTILDNLATLAPIMGEIARYLSKEIEAMTAKEAKNVGDLLLRVGTKSAYAGSSFVALCIVDLLTRFPRLASFGRALAFVDSNAALGVRSKALLARAHDEVYWVRSQKEGFMDLGPWDRRALIWSAGVLPGSERDVWLGKIQGQLEDPLEVALARRVAGL